MAAPGKHLIVDCSVCGKPYRQSRSTQLYCSSICGSAAWRLRSYNYSYIKCAHCSKEFKRLHSKQIYCEKSCRDLSEKKRKKVDGGVGKGWSKGKQFVDKTSNSKCFCCGVDFYVNVPPSKLKGGGKFCSTKCRTKAIAMNPSMYPQTQHKRSKIGKRPDLCNQFFRSAWEANYARYLNLLIKAREITRWEFEPDTFEFDGIKRGTRFYTPDFKVFNNNGTFEYHEIKGYMDARSATKLKRMKKYHPKIKLILIDKVGYAAIAKIASKLVSGWEGNYGCK